MWAAWLEWIVKFWPDEDAQFQGIIGIFSKDKIIESFKSHGLDNLHWILEILQIPKLPRLWLYDQNWGHSDQNKMIGVKTVEIDVES